MYRIHGAKAGAAIALLGTASIAYGLTINAGIQHETITIVMAPIFGTTVLLSYKLLNVEGFPMPKSIFGALWAALLIGAALLTATDLIGYCLDFLAGFHSFQNVVLPAKAEFHRVSNWCVVFGAAICPLGFGITMANTLLSMSHFAFPSDKSIVA